MIVTDTKKDVQTNGSWKIIPFSIKATAKTFKTWSSDIYQHKVRAVIRELSCNAVDAHTVSGNMEQFKVHLPTYLEQWFSVRDYGYGLSEKEMTEVFIVFFDSTKTDTNSLIGSYGLGSKSPFSIAESFIVHSYQNNTKSSYSLFTDENGLPQMASLGIWDTDEPDGLEIIVSTSAVDEFQREAVEVYKWFEKLPIINSTSVLTNISEAKSHYKVTGDGFGMNLKTGSTKAIMGGVAYDIPQGYCTKLESYIHFEIGDLSVNPGRETLSLDDKTKEALYAKRDFLLENFKDAVYDTINVEETAFLRARKLFKVQCGMLASILTPEQLKFLNDNFELPKPSQPIIRYEFYKNKCTTLELSDLPLGKAERYFRFQPKFEQRIRKFVRENRTRVIVLTDQQIDECKIDLELIEDLDIMPKVVRNAATKRVKVLSSQTGLVWNSSELDVNQEYIYVDVFRGKTIKYSRYKTERLFTMAKSFGYIPVLYGLTTAVKKKGKGIELSDYLKSKLKPINKILTKLPEYAKILAVVDDRFKAKPMDEELHSIYVTCGLEVQHDDFLDKLEAEYLAAYPLIPHIDFDSSAVEAIKSYIQLIKA